MKIKFHISKFYFFDKQKQSVEEYWERKKSETKKYSLQSKRNESKNWSNSYNILILIIPTMGKII